MTELPEGPRAAAVRRQVTDLVRDHGTALLEDPRRVRAMLADTVAGAKAETSLVVLSLRSGVPAMLEEALAGTDTVADALASTAQCLQETGSVQEADARWAVAVVAEALGWSTPYATTVASPGPVPDDRPRPASGPAPAPFLPVGTPREASVLVVAAAGQEERHATASFTIGRDPTNDLVLDRPVISRHHARVETDPGGWRFRDLDSTQGSFVDGTAVSVVAITGPTVVVLGQGADAVALTLSPRATATPDAQQLPAGLTAATVVAPGSVGMITAVLRGRTVSVGIGGTLTVGPDPGNDLVASAATVSRRHLLIERSRDRWRLRDLGSTSGTWLDGHRVDSVPLDGTQEFVLGDARSGDRLITHAPAVEPSAWQRWLARRPHRA
jgi:pSer/pThr/pTyr-binding forkhead associated (FHA) protein